MSALHLPLLEARLERICEKGCKRVWRDIACLEQGEELPEAAGLNAAERAWLLQELKTVMAVYGQRCSVDGPTE
ncbi:hypothetical protein F2Q65_18615 [Thiohalocapsa marina]|uniref:Uncharacterized protein n=1 Tax=Thiohalocapsa marina TaxID=424902 RepID=A0A5M8FAM0_9GAMM|nr:hypothetical protein [Thiohalocapsa marina]KAA6181888.1 hypothetical protein F2Q65_18615 [Thiohalocapsa marina]